MSTRPRHGRTAIGRTRPSGAGAAWLLVAAVLCAVPGPGVSAGSGDTSGQLQDLRARLKGLEKSLDDTRGERDNVRDALRDTERDIGGLLRNLKQLNASLRSQTARLAALQEEKAKQRRQIQTQVGHLENEVRSAYVLGRQEDVKLLLSQENPASVSRALTYHHYLQRARAARIQAARTTLNRLLALEEQIETRTRELKTTQSEEMDKQQVLVATRTRRRGLLAQLNQRVQNQSQEVERLRLDEQRLVRLLQELQVPKNRPPPDDLPPMDGRFADLRGKLPLPVQGRIVARYGMPRPGGLKWRGIFLSSPEGRNVVSVFRGRVVYADWLRGFGLLLILEHGDGYMTLYGHNQSLYKEAGDWVEAGQTVASVGSTGGPPEPGLYFEVRHNGEPSNPLDWCRIR